MDNTSGKHFPRQRLHVFCGKGDPGARKAPVPSGRRLKEMFAFVAIDRKTIGALITQEGAPVSDRSATSPILADRLATLCNKYPAANPRMVADVMRAVIDMFGVDPQLHDNLMGEIEGLGRTIANAKAEIAALGTENVGKDNVSAASDELDAVVAHTADATNAILEACESLDNAAASPGGPSLAVVSEATGRIYEACSFQDITGQRITKVVSTLKAVEAKVAKIVDTFGQQSWDAVGGGVRNVDPRPDSHLLNGPQLTKAAMAQNDIDAMLSDF